MDILSIVSQIYVKAGKEHWKQMYKKACSLTIGYGILALIVILCLSWQFKLAITDREKYICLGIVLVCFVLAYYVLNEAFKKLYGDFYKLSALISGLSISGFFRYKNSIDFFKEEIKKKKIKKKELKYIEEECLKPRIFLLKMPMFLKQVLTVLIVTFSAEILKLCYKVPKLLVVFLVFLALLSLVVIMGISFSPKVTRKEIGKIIQLFLQYN